MKAMKTLTAGVAWVVVGVIGAGAAHAHWPVAWKPALHDADELYDAAEDLHDRAERFQDVRLMPVTAHLERLTSDLYRLLKRNACPADVVTTLNATGAVLEEASLLVSLSCELRGDRKALSELANARRYYALTSHHVQCLLNQ